MRVFVSGILASGHGQALVEQPPRLTLDPQDVVSRLRRRAAADVSVAEGQGRGFWLLAAASTAAAAALLVATQAWIAAQDPLTELLSSIGMVLQ